MAIQMRLFAEDGMLDMREPHEDDEDDVEDVSLAPCDCESDCERCARAHKMTYDEWCGCVECVERVMDFWELPGVLHDHEESSYLNDTGPGDHWARLPFSYDACTVRELKQFIQERDLTSLDPYPPGSTLKYYYLRLFEKADQCRQFRFLDLPAELRNEVYLYLLVFPDGCPCHNSCDPIILQTCKEINEEASSILYSENPIRCHFGLCTGSHGFSEKDTLVHNSENLKDLERLPKAIDAYPAFLGRITHLRLSLKYVVVPCAHAIDEEGFAPLNHLVYSLASFLMDKKLKALDLVLDIDGSVTDLVLGKILFPLRRLRNLTQLNVKGTRKLPAGYLVRMQHDMQHGIEPAFNTMRHWQILVDQVHPAMNLVTVLPSSGCGCGDCEDCDDFGVDRLYQISTPFDEVIRMQKKSAFHSGREEAFIAKLAVLEQALKLLDVEALQREIDDFVKARETKKKLDRVSDDGRLEEALKIWKNRHHDQKAIDAAADDWPVEENRVSPEL